MRVLRAEPKTRVKSIMSLGQEVRTNLATLDEVRLNRARVNLGEFPVRGPAPGRVDWMRKRVAADLGEYPLRGLPTESASRRRAKSLLRWTQRLLLLAGLLGVGTWGWFYAESAVYQRYQSWRLDQLVKHRPAELKALLESYLAKIEIDYLAKIGIDVTNEPPPLVTAPPKAPTPSPPSALPAEGTLIGRMEIPRLALSAVVLEGVSDPVLRKAAGHIPGTALPGAEGNVAIAGHRDTFFRALRNVRKDDDIALETSAGTYHYRVSSTDVVSPEDVQVLKPSDQSSLTLVTCYPFSYVGSAPDRYIVRARRIKSAPTAPSSSQPKPFPLASSPAPGNPSWQARSTRQAKVAHHVAWRVAPPRHARHPRTPRGGRHVSPPSDNEGDVATAALSNRSADAHKRGGLGQRALAVPKRFASWLRSTPKRPSVSE